MAMSRTRRLLTAWLIVGSILFLFCWYKAAEAAEPNGRAHRAVVRICNETAKDFSYGSGTVINHNGQPAILTCWHIFRDGVGQIHIGFPGGNYAEAKLLAADETWDLAVLAIPQPDVTPVEIASDYARPGEAITSCGWGTDCGYVYSTGTALGYVSTIETGLRETLQTSGRGGAGNSGGPMFNDRGELAAVCWGADNEGTYGTFCDRIRRFLAAVVQPRGILRPVSPPAKVCDPNDPSCRTPLPGALPPPPAKLVNPLLTLPPVEADSIDSAPPPIETSPPTGAATDLPAVVREAVASAIVASQVPGTPPVSLLDAAIPVVLAGLGWTGPPAIAAVVGLKVLSAVIRRRRRGKPEKSGKPFPVSLPPDEPPPQIVRRQREFVGYRVPDRALKALEWAHDEYVRRHPGARSTIETIEAYAQQYLSGHPDEFKEQNA